MYFTKASKSGVWCTLFENVGSCQFLNINMDAKSVENAKLPSLACITGEKQCTPYEVPFKNQYYARIGIIHICTYK